MGDMVNLTGNGRRTGSLRRSVRPFLVCALLSTWTVVEAAVAQSPARLPDEDGGWFQWVVAVGLGVAVCAAAFVNPKRSHLT